MKRSFLSASRLHLGASYYPEHWYVGAYLDDAAQQTLMEHMLTAAGVSIFVNTPGIEISRRVQPSGDEVYIMIDHNATACVVHLPWTSFDHLNGSPRGMDFDMPGYSVAVLTPDEKRI